MVFCPKLPIFINCKLWEVSLESFITGKATYQTKTTPDKYKAFFLTPCKSSWFDNNRFLSLSISVAHSFRMLAFAFPLHFSTVSSGYCDISMNDLIYSFSQWNPISKLRNLTDWPIASEMIYDSQRIKTDHSDLKSAIGKGRPKI